MKLEIMKMPYMKKCFLHLFAALLTLSAAGCADDGEPRRETEEPVYIVMSPQEALTRAGATDDDISTFRVLLFERTNGRGLRYNFYYDDFLNASRTLVLTVHTGAFDFVFVANEAGDTRLHNVLENLATGAQLSSLDSEYFSAASFTDTDYVPMAGVARNVNIIEDYKLQVDGGAAITTSWDIGPYLKRLAVRIDFNVATADSWVWNNLTSFQIDNLPSKVYLFEQNVSSQAIYNNDGTYTAARSFTTADCDSGTGWSGGTGTWKKARIIVPSNVFTPAATKANAITVKANLLGVSPVSVALGRALGTNDYTSPRGTYYTFNGTLQQAEIKFTVEVASWGAVQNVDME